MRGSSQAAVRRFVPISGVKMSHDPLEEPPAEPLETSGFEAVELVPGQGEDEGDGGDDGATFQAAIGSKDWTVETLVSQMRKGRIDLDPSFQRRNAWLDNRKSKLIESILLGYPIPQIVLAEKHDTAGHYFVLDGKQRLLALRQFFVDPKDDRDRYFDHLKLKGLEVLTEYNGMDAASLDESYAAKFAALENHSIRTVVLSNWNSERLLLSLFLRLNTGSVPLSPQELRQALIHGDFMQWLDRVSGELPALRRLLNNKSPDRRMVDAELMLRHFAFTNSPGKYGGNLKQFLDDTSRYFNDEWSSVSADMKRMGDEFDAALSLGMDIFGTDTFCRKWSANASTYENGHFERAINRAVFDFQVYSLTVDGLDQLIAANADAVIDKFKRECFENVRFARAITSTTKTAEAFITRHRVWQGILTETCGRSYELPLTLRRN
jgi:hypothetical protein